MIITFESEYRTYKRPDSVEVPTRIPEWLKAALLADFERKEELSKKHQAS